VTVECGTLSGAPPARTFMASTTATSCPSSTASPARPRATRARPAWARRARATCPGRPWGACAARGRARAAAAPSPPRCARRPAAGSRARTARWPARAACARERGAVAGVSIRSASSSGEPGDQVTPARRSVSVGPVARPRPRGSALLGACGVMCTTHTSPPSQRPPRRGRGRSRGPRSWRPRRRREGVQLRGG